MQVLSWYSHLCPFNWRNIGHCWILNYPSIQKLHYVEWRANNTAVFAEAICLRHRYIGLFESMYDLVFSFDLMGGLREQFSRRFFTHHKLLTILRCELIGRVRLSKAKLQWLAVPRGRRGCVHTCLRSMGSLIARTFWEMYRSSDCKSMGCLTAPAIAYVEEGCLVCW